VDYAWLIGHYSAGVTTGGRLMVVVLPLSVVVVVVFVVSVSVLVVVVVGLYESEIFGV